MLSVEDSSAINVTQPAAEVQRAPGRFRARVPVHDHGVQGGLSGLVGAAAEAHGAVTALLLARRTAALNRVQRRPSSRQRPPRWQSNPKSARVDTDFFFFQCQRQQTRNGLKTPIFKTVCTFTAS